RILDTRKTLPGLRLAQKYALRCASGTNPLLRLYDPILTTHHHILVSTAICPAIPLPPAAHPGLPVEIEVETIDELREALAAGADRLLLDNFSLDELRLAVQITRDEGSAAELEASGGITLEQVAEIAATGVHYISIGALTKHVRAIDFSMRVEL